MSRDWQPSSLLTDPHTTLDATEPFEKPWNKVDGTGKSYRLIDREHLVRNLRGREAEFSLDTSGFAVYHAPTQEKDFVDDAAIRKKYYDEIKALLRERLPGIRSVVVFDHTIRHADSASPRRPVQLVHIDQTPGAAEARVRRHLPLQEVESLLKRRYQIVNLWRPIRHVASDFPLAVMDWRSKAPSDLVKVDLLYPKGGRSGSGPMSDSDSNSPDGYEVMGEQYAVAPNEKHEFYYVKNMMPDEIMLIKFFDSRSSQMTEGETDIAHGSGHSAFIDPQTPENAPGRQSIEVRCLVFYE